MNIIPTNRSVDEGVQTTFTCIATGVDNNTFTYQWLLNNYLITGENKRILNVTALQAHSGNYTCSVQDQYGNTNQSEEAVLIISSM